MTELLILVAVFVVATVVGYALISRVPPLLHTPLMSMTNAISAVTILGAFVLFSSRLSPWEALLAAVALAAATFNVVGGFAITARMLRMFRRK